MDRIVRPCLSAPLHFLSVSLLATANLPAHTLEHGAAFEQAPLEHALQEVALEEQPEPAHPSTASTLSVEKDQVVSSSRGLQPIEQITGGRPSLQSLDQVSSGGRSAQPPEPISEPADGRTGAVPLVRGQDRCDPSGPSPKPLAICANLLEDRAAEFTPKRLPRLSAEQQILLSQSAAHSPGTTQSVARRLAADSAPNSDDGQAIASLMMPTGSDRLDTSESAEPLLSPDVQGILGVILNGVGTVMPDNPR